MTRQIVTLQIRRSGGLQNYTVPFSDGMTLLTALRKIAAEQDGTLAFRDTHCGRGVCMACLVKLNGEVTRACSSPLEAGAGYLVEPANDKVIRDLLCVL